MSVLEVDDVARSFGGIKAVEGVSLTVEKQESVGLIGPNGSGKSTLFNLVSGVFKPDRGQVRFLDQNVTGWPTYRVARAGMGRTFQIPALFLNMTVRQNLLAAAVESDWTGAPARAMDVMELLDLTPLSEELADTLSGGQQKLLEFGRVLMRDPALILLDEITAGVHPRLRAVILKAIDRQREGGKSFIVIEHDMELVRTICDRVVVMDFGEVVARGSFAEIAQNPEVVQAYLGRPAAS